jgi:hypothetical protein
MASLRRSFRERRLIDVHDLRIPIELGDDLQER